MEAGQLARGEVKRRLVRACRELEALVAGSYGPLGRAQLVQANAQCPDALTATAVAERFFASVDIGDCPIANAYFHMLKSKIRRHADAGLFLAGLSASLQLEIQEGSLAEIPHRVVSRGLQVVLDWVLEYLDDPACPVRAAVNWSSEIALSAVIRGVVSSKSTTGMNEVTTDTVVIPLIIQAFVSVFAFVVENPGESVPVQLLFASGQKSMTQSQLWKQTVLLDLPWPYRARRQGTKRSLLSPPICNVRVALFNITIEPLAEFEEEDISTSVNHSGSLKSFRLQALRQVGDRLERLGATAVLSQKIIPKYLQTYLAAKGIFTLDRLSATNIRGVQMLSGATILSDWRIDDSIICSALGFLSLITTQTLGMEMGIQ
ncbi:Thermosome subunit alpha [Phytophthora cinnamomi]|uniref:Thermosome subunit alpha n=1 Tax=Phytophthora cinnamomi TaxID=4785 RepID=UPI003559CBD5|nr:Thermosome subunit alpha [Phytophthora cinnamomi]